MSRLDFYEAPNLVSFNTLPENSILTKYESET